MTKLKDYEGAAVRIVCNINTFLTFKQEASRQPSLVQSEEDKMGYIENYGRIEHHFRKTRDTKLWQN